MKLNFWKTRYAPHGAFGVASLTSTGSVTLSALSGHQVMPEFVHISSALIILNAISSIPLLSRTQNVRNELFIQSIFIQCALAYMSVRVLHNDELFALSDFVCFLTIMVALQNIWKASSHFDEFNIPLKSAVICASTFALYPLQFSILGQDWWSYIQNIYPEQSVGFSQYVFIPSEFIVALIMFAATLIERKLLTITQTRILFFLPIVILFATITAQEIYMPYTATQDLIIGCSFSNPITIFNILKTLFE